MTVETLHLTVAATLDDQVRLYEVLLRQPFMRRRYWRRMVAGLLLYPVVVMAAGFVGGTLAAGVMPTPWAAVDLVASDPWSWLAEPWLLLAGVFVAVALLNRVMRRFWLRRRLRAVLRVRPGVNPADPALTETVACSLGLDGYRVQSAGYTHHVPWAGITGLDETPEIMALITGPMAGYVLPRRCATEDQLAAVRAIVARHLRTS